MCKQKCSTDVQCLSEMVISIIFISRTNKTGHHAYSLSHLPTSEDKLDSLISAVGLIKTWCQKNWVLEKERNKNVQLLQHFSLQIGSSLIWNCKQTSQSKRREGKRLWSRFIFSSRLGGEKRLKDNGRSFLPWAKPPMHFCERKQSLLLLTAAQNCIMSPGCFDFFSFLSKSQHIGSSRAQ